jgi:hypothetical protein
MSVQVEGNSIQPKSDSTMQQEGSKGRLESLPSSNDTDFWAEADVHTGIEPKVMFLDQNHYFERVSGHQAMCRHCDWGFQLDPGDKIIDGHLFDRTGKKVL